MLKRVNVIGSLGDFSAPQQPGYLTTSPLAIPLDLPADLTGRIVNRAVVTRTEVADLINNDIMQAVAYPSDGGFI